MKKRILIVEDDAALARVLSDNLTFAGFEVETEDDGRVRYRYCQSAVVAAYGEMASLPPAFADVRVPTLLVLGEQSYLPYDHLLDAHRAALGDLLEVAVDLRTNAYRERCLHYAEPGQVDR